MLSVNSGSGLMSGGDWWVLDVEDTESIICSISV